MIAMGLQEGGTAHPLQQNLVVFFTADMMRLRIPRATLEENGAILAQITLPACECKRAV